MNIRFFFFFFVLMSARAPAQMLKKNIILQSIALNAYSSKQADVFSFTGNQASLARVSASGVGVFSEQRFLLNENSSFLLAGNIITNHANVGLLISYAGFPSFNEIAAGMAIAKKLSEKIDLGIQFNYFSSRAAGYGNSSVINAAAGCIIRLNSKLNAGIYCHNPFGSEIRFQKAAQSGYAYKFGLGYDASEEFMVSMELVKEEDMPVYLLSGFRYRFRQQFFAGITYSSSTESINACAGFRRKNTGINFSFNYHPQLGITPGLSVSMNFKSAD